MTRRPCRPAPTPGTNTAATLSTAADMTSEGFAAWRARMAVLKGLKTYSHAAAARDLGLSVPMVKLYEKGANNARRDAQGKALAVVIPQTVALACAALESGLTAE